MAMPSGELFNGAIPTPLLPLMTKHCGIENWSSVWVGCSGTFSFERAINLAFPQKSVFSNDVSLLSALIASVAQSKPLEFTFIGKLERFEQLLKGKPYIDRASALILCMILAQRFKGPSQHTAKHWAFYERDFEQSLERPRKRLIELAASLRLADYMPGDFRQHINRCAEAKGGFVVSAPFLKNFYEGWFRFIHNNVKWSPPTYDVWNPDDMPALLNEMDRLGVPFCVAYNAPIEGRYVAGCFRKGLAPPFYLITSHQPSQTSLIDRPPVNPISPFQFKPIDISRLTDDPKIVIAPCTAGHANYIKQLYLQDNIAFTSGLVNMLVWVDDMVAGVMTFTKLTSGIGGVKTNESVYLLSDTSTSRFGRISKLIAMLATSKQVLDYVASRIIHRPIGHVVTTVRSNNPVSMKYRGIYELALRKKADEKERSGSDYILSYMSAPRHQSFDEIYAEWRQKHFKDDRARKVTNSYARKETDG
jgi:hypothetical protein